MDDDLAVVETWAYLSHTSGDTALACPPALDCEPSAVASLCICTLAEGCGCRKHENPPLFRLGCLMHLGRACNAWQP